MNSAVMAMRGPNTAVGESGAGLVLSVEESERHTKERMAAMKKHIDLSSTGECESVIGTERTNQASHTAGIANSTHTFHQMNVVVLRASCGVAVSVREGTAVPCATYLSPTGGFVHTSHGAKADDVDTAER